MGTRGVCRRLRIPARLRTGCRPPLNPAAFLTPGMSSAFRWTFTAYSAEVRLYADVVLCLTARFAALAAPQSGIRERGRDGERVGAIRGNRIPLGCGGLSPIRNPQRALLHSPLPPHLHV